MASIATSAVPSNDAAARPATISASARVASTSQFIANGPDFSTMLAQTNAASARPPTKTDPQAKPQVPVKQATVKQAAVNKAGTMPKIADPIQAPPKTAATPAGSQPTKAASSKTGKGSASSGSQFADAGQKQDAPSSPIIGGIQTGPVFYQPGNPIADQTGDMGDTGIPPRVVLTDARHVPAQNAVDAQNLPGAQAGSASQTDEDDQGKIPDATALSSAELVDTLNSHATSPAIASKDAAAPQTSGKTPNSPQLTALIQSLPPAAHREAATQAPQATDSQSVANSQTQAPGNQSQSSDGGSSNGGQDHGAQAHASNGDASSPSPSPSPDAANTVAAQSPSAAVNSSNALTSTASSTGGISAAVAAQNAPAGTSAVALHVSPNSPANVPGPQPDLNMLAIAVAAKSQAGAKQFDISLDPAELGKVEVRLTVDSAGNAQAHLVAERPETLQLLQRDSGTLSHALKDAGVQLGNNGLQFSLKGQERQSDNAQQGAGRGKPLNVSAVAASQNIPTTSSTYGLALSQTGIDIRV